MTASLVFSTADAQMCKSKERKPYKFVSTWEWKEKTLYKFLEYCLCSATKAYN